jgi:hypothetical protein
LHSHICSRCSATALFVCRSQLKSVLRHPPPVTPCKLRDAPTLQHAYCVPKSLPAQVVHRVLKVGRPAKSVLHTSTASNCL